MANRGTDAARSACRLAGALAAISTATAAHGQTILYVDDDAPAGGNGRSWGEAFRDLQDALWLASYVHDDIEIRIAEGIYKPDRGTGVRDASFDIDNTMVGSAIMTGFGMSLRGAFAGIKALDPNERDTHKFKSVLSGDLNGDDQPGFLNYEDNSHHIVRMTDVTNSGVEFDGLVFRGGNGEKNLRRENGGALLLQHWTFRESQVTLRNCIFVDNWARDGGAVSLSLGQFVISGCYFGNNRAESDGGAIRNNHWANTVVTDCVFSGNSANTHGAAISSTEYLEVTACTFFGNSAAMSPGVISGEISAISNTVIFSNTPLPVFPNNSTVPISFSCIEGGYPGIGNIDTNPLFTDPDGEDNILGTPDDNFMPRFGSAVIDAGLNSAVINPQGFDYAGQPRIVDDRFTPDTGVGTGPIVDMGAYEFQMPDCYADVDHTTGVGVLDLFDYLRFQGLFVMNDPYACQVDRSTGPNVCDIFDFLAFQSEFLAGCP